jgi:hypothetical protein
MPVIDRQWTDEIGEVACCASGSSRSVRAVSVYVHDRSPHAAVSSRTSERDSPAQSVAISHDGADGERILR